jgi:DNA (cytosine-5)-methyltransferase 1
VLRLLDAFCGAGGLSLGFELAGWETAFAFDSDPIAVDTFNKNHAGHASVMDAIEVSGQDLLELSTLAPGECDLLAGGPPCQGFSLQRRGLREDPRSELVLRYIDWIQELNPKAFVLENVHAIRSVRGSHLIAEVRAFAEGAGYATHVETLDAVDYDVPQIRRRAFLVGAARGRRFEWPTPASARLTVRDAIADLPSPPEDGSPHRLIANHYREARLSPINRERIRAVPEGGGREDLPLHLQLDCHKSGHRHLDTYGRMAWDRPAPTITARFDSFTRGRFGHPVEDRSITLREGARLQGFPDSFVFLGNREDGARMIGNAVPPPLATHVARSITRMLLDRPAPQ